MQLRDDVLLKEARSRLQQGDYAGAGRRYRSILRHRPADPEALYMLGVLGLRQGKAADAVTLICRALDSGQSRDPVVLENLGAAYLMVGNVIAAESVLREAIEAGDARALLKMRLGMALMGQKRWHEAEEVLRAAQHQDPRDIDIVVNLGNLLAIRGRVEAALEQFHHALDLDPSNAQTLFNIGTLHRETGRLDEANEFYLRALTLDPQHVDSMNNLGTIRERKGDFPGAVDLYKRVLAIDSRNVYAYSNLASVTRRQGKLDEAIQFCKRALELQPAFVDALANLGGLLAEQGEIEGAMRLYRQAMKAAPNDGELRCRFGMLLLSAGNFSDAWSYYQSRASRRNILREVDSLDANLPEKLGGVTVLIVGEQGIGDELFFLRFADVLKSRGARLICSCDPKIESLLERTGLFDDLIRHRDSLPQRDLTFAAGDLPMVIGSGRTSIGPGYVSPLRLKPAPERIEAMRDLLSIAGPPPYLGLTWRSGTPLSQQQGWRNGLLSKEVPLEALASAVRGKRATFISLQRNPGSGETVLLGELIGAPVYDVSEVNEDLENMLALVYLLQEYVGVSNTNMHLMAGLGKGAHVIVPNPPEWRWMTSGTSSPWFPNFEIYRQGWDGSWEGAMKRLREKISTDSEAVS